MTGTRGPRLLLHLILASAFLAAFAGAEWSVQYTPRVGIFDANIASSTLVLQTSARHTHSAITDFYQAINSNRELLPGQCDVVGNNKYGFAKWRDRVRFLGGQVLSVTFTHTPGWAILEDETIVCGLVDPATDKNVYGTRPNEVVSPNAISFTIMRSPADVTVKLSGSLIGMSDEKDVRKGGFELALELGGGDVWLPQRKQQILDAIGSTSGTETNVLQTLLGLTVADLTILEDEPNKVVIRYSAEQLADFDIGASLLITFTPVAQLTLKQDAPKANGELSKEITHLPTKPELLITAGPDGAELPDDVLEISEDCLRGVDNPVPPCTLEFTMGLRQKDTFFVETVGNDIMRAAFTIAPHSEAELANQTGISQLYKSIAYGMVQNAPSQTLLVVSLNTIPDLDVSNTSDIHFVVPTALIDNREPPLRGRMPVIIRIVPSPARVTGTAVNVLQSAVWTGGVAFNVTLDGEQWEQNATRAMFADAVTTTPTAVSGTNPFGFPTLRHDLVPGSELTFPAPNILTVAFVQNVDYELRSATETLQFTVNSSMVASGLTPASQTGLTMQVTGVDPTMVVFGRREFHERDVWGGTVEFVLTLAGARWRTDDFMAQCGSKLTWSTDATAVDDKGWHVAAVRDALLQDAIQLPPEKRSLTVRFNPLPNTTYDVVAGETISVAIATEARCTSDGGTKQPVGEAQITIAPQAAWVESYFVETEAIAATAADPAALSALRLPVPLSAIATGTAAALGGPSNADVLPTVTESRVRAGGIAFVSDLTADRFDVSALDTRTAAGRQAIVQAMVGTGTEATGWNIKKSFVVDVANVALRRDGAQLVVPLVFYAPFGVAEAERVGLRPEASWLRSQVVPEDPVAFYVDASPGLVDLGGWTGFSNNDTITEEELRSGGVSFELRLLGDSWSSDRNAYAESLVAVATTDDAASSSGDDQQTAAPSATLLGGVGIETARYELIPGMEFWAFGSTGGYATLGVVFQRALSYDVSKPETVRFKLANRTVASPFAPSWLVRGAEVPSFEFTVRPSAGELMLSGAIHSVAEQDIRRSTVEIRLRLHGETFNTTSSNVEALVLDALRGADTGPSAFNAMKQYLLPLISGGATPAIDVRGPDLVLTLRANRTFALTTPDTIRLLMPPVLFASGLLPHFTSPFADDAMDAEEVTDVVVGGVRYARALSVPLVRVQRSGGEIRASVVGANASADGSVVIPEAVMSQALGASAPVYIDLSLDGDLWDVDMVRARPGEFLAGFSSLTPSYTETSGFNRNRYDLLQLGAPGGAVTVLSNTTVRVAWCVVCAGVTYDIDSEDDVVFSVTRAGFMQTGVVPSPTALPLRIEASARWITAELRLDASQTTFWSGQLTASRLRVALAEFLTAHESQIEVRDNTVVGGRTVRFRFIESTAADIVASDARSPAQIMKLFVSVNRTFVAERMAADHVYLEEEGRPAATLPPDATLAEGAVATDRPETLSDQVGGAFWFLLLLTLGGIGAVFVLVSDVNMRRATPVGMLVGGQAVAGSGKRPMAYIGDERVNVLAGDEQHDIPLDDNRHYAGQRHLYAVQEASNSEDTDEQRWGGGIVMSRANPLEEMKPREPLRQFVRRQVEQRAEAERDQAALGRNTRSVATTLAGGGGGAEDRRRYARDDPFDVAPLRNHGGFDDDDL